MTAFASFSRHLRRPPSRYLRRFRQKLAARNLAPIYLNGLPKSGNTFIYENLAHGLYRKTAIDVSRNFVIRSAGVEAMMRDKSIVRDTAPPTPENLAAINGRLDRMVVVVRDPRQALLSWFVPFDAAVSDPASGKDVGMVLGVFPNYRDMPVSARLDILIDHRFQWMVEWIHGWLDASEDPDFSPEIMFIRQEELKDGGRDVFERILDFYDIDHGLFDFPPPPVAGRHKFRKGQTDEWRDVLTEPQKARITAAIPERMFRRFG